MDVPLKSQDSTRQSRRGVILQRHFLPTLSRWRKHCGVDKSRLRAFPGLGVAHHRISAKEENSTAVKSQSLELRASVLPLRLLQPSTRRGFSDFLAWGSARPSWSAFPATSLRSGKISRITALGSLLPAAVEPQPIVRARTDLRLFLMLHQGEHRFFHALKVKFCGILKQVWASLSPETLPWFA